MEDRPGNLSDELWTMIFGFVGERKEISNLRQVSRHFRRVIDGHQLFSVKITGTGRPDEFSSAVPGHHVRIGELFLCKTPRLPLRAIKKRQLTRLKKLQVLEDYNPAILKRVLRGSPNLEKLCINFDSSLHSIRYRGVNECYNLKTKKIQEISIRKQNLKLFEPPLIFCGQIKRRLAHNKRFLSLVFSILKPSRLYPSLTSLTLEFNGLTYSAIDELMTFCIIPCLVRHSNILQYLEITLIPSVEEVRKYGQGRTGGVGRASHTIVETRNTCMQAVVSMIIKLPDEFLDRLLVGLFGNVSKLTENTLELLALNWFHPYIHSTSSGICKDYKDKMFTILRHLVCRNKDSLETVFLQNLDANHGNVFSNCGRTVVGGGMHSHCVNQFQNLCQVVLTSRPSFARMHNTITFSRNYMVNFFIPFRYMQLERVIFRGICLRASDLRNALESYPLLKLIHLRNNIYNNCAQKIDCGFIMAMVSKPGMQELVIGPQDLAVPYNNQDTNSLQYWESFNTMNNLFTKSFDQNIGLTVKLQ